MTKRLVGWFLLLPFAILLVLIALANRQSVRVGLDPFGLQTAWLPSFDVPLFAVIYAMLLVGVVLGGLATWLTQGRQRRERRRFRKEAERLGRELDTIRRPAMPAPARKGLPATDDLLELE
ncbi:MAG: DUF1049 domain-containing protein [Alphaproteobacteria bacterium]|nr:DUF1049 domain-containing protein [Alphaproteobacteria bacterium]